MALEQIDSVILWADFSGFWLGVQPSDYARAYRNRSNCFLSRLKGEYSRAVLVASVPKRDGKSLLLILGVMHYDVGGGLRPSVPPTACSFKAMLISLKSPSTWLIYSRKSYTISQQSSKNVA